eukprot:gene3696-10459_t
MSKLRERLAKHRGAQPDALTCAVCGDTYVRAALSADGKEMCKLACLQKYIAAKQNAEGEGGSGKRKEHRGGDTNDSAARGGSEESARTGAAAAGAGAAAAASVPMRRGAAPSAADLAAFEAARPLLPWKIKAPLLFAVLLVSGFLGWAVMGLIAVCCYLMYEFTDGSGRKKRPGEKSAYSVFNRGVEQIQGTFSADDIDRQYRTGSLR